MFWRILWRLLCASRGRLALALLAVASGATVCATLVNLDLDANDKLTREFRVLGANIVVSPLQTGNTPATMDATILDTIGALHTPEISATAPYLYVAAQAGDKPGIPVIAAGTWFDEVAHMNSWWKVTGQWVAGRDDRADCMVGQKAAQQLGLAPGSSLTLHYAGRELTLKVMGVVTSGGSEDVQIFANLSAVQELAGLNGRISVAQLSAQGAAPAIEAVVQYLAAALPGLSVQPVRQLAAAEGNLLERIHSLLFATVALILLLTAMGVLAAMAGLAIERRRDVGLMKALGGSVRRVMRLFLAEAATIGIVGGIIGCAAGMAAAAWIGQRVFATAITPRLIVLPITLVLTVLVALAGALPLRLLGRVRPAEILRGE